MDLLLLHPGLDDGALKAVVREIVYPLWDAGLTVGYAVRTRGEAVAAAEDLDVATATLDARLVCGDGLLLHDVIDGLGARLTSGPARFLDALTATDEQRRARAGDAAEVLEPDVKRGAGGLRDVQSLTWAAAALVGRPGLDPLVSSRHLGAPDRARLVRATDRLLAERVALHLAAGRPLDVLRFDLQDEVAARLGYRDGPSDRDTAAHRLLSDHFLAARTVDHVHRRAWTLITADARRGRWSLRRPPQRVVDGFEIVDGVLRLPADLDPAAADIPVRLLTVLTDEEAVLDRRAAGTLRRLAEAAAGDADVDGDVHGDAHGDGDGDGDGRTSDPARPDGPGPDGPRPDDPRPDWRWDDAARRGFLRVLWSGRAALDAVAELDDVGVITALIPEWRPIRGRAQRNPFHRFSLDRHCWHAAAELGALVRREEWAAITLEAVVDRDALMLATLLHDVGKAHREPHGRPHTLTGVPVARDIARRMGAGEETVAQVGRLVALHLLLPDVAGRRDLSDPGEIRRVAAEVGDHRMLAALHLLTAADGLATGPSAWTSWKASLVQTLVTKVRAVLDEHHPDDVADGATATAAEAQRLGPELGVDPGTVRGHLALLPSRYASSVSPRSVVRHAGMAGEALQPAEVRTRVTPGEHRDEDGLEDYDQLDVVTADRPGLFAKVAGVLALHGGDVLAASGFAREDGVAVDTFTVQPPEDATGSFWARVEGDLVEAVGGRLALRARVGRRIRAERRRLERLPDVATRVTVTPGAGGSASVVEVHTADRIGVLYEVTAALAELELDIVVARIQTMGHEVVDAFYVRDAAGAPLDEDHAAEVELAVTAALDGG